jgi:uncharacterized membrane protein YeaQ/YmgE (transglycosylase-associated protein family)
MNRNRPLYLLDGRPALHSNCASSSMPATRVLMRVESLQLGYTPGIRRPSGGSDMTITGIISAIIIGLIIGALGRLVVPGKQGIPIWLTIIIGIIAAFIGAAIAGAIGYANANGGIPWIEIIIQVVIAAIGVSIAAGAYARRGVTR